MNLSPSLALWSALALGQSTPALTLDQALRLASQNRPAVQAATLRVEQAKFQRRSLSALASTRLDLQATTNRNLYGNDDDLSLTQPIDLFGRRSANRHLGDAQVQLAEANLRQTLLDVQGEVVEGYADTAAAGQLVQTAAAQFELCDRLLAATRQRSDGGAVPPVQIKRVSLEVERARQTLKLREAALEAARKRLAGALGIPVDKLSQTDFPEITIDRLNLTSQRADLLRLSAQASMAQANVAVSRLELKPEFELSARTSPYSYGPNQPAGLRATLSIPIFDHGHTKNEVKAAQTGAEAERKALADATAKAQAELEAVTVELAAANEQRASFERLLDDSRELVRVSEVGYREGATTLLEVLEATRSLREVEESLIEAKRRVAQVQAALLKTTGTLLGEAR